MFMLFVFVPYTLYVAALTVGVLLHIDVVRHLTLQQYVAESYLIIPF